jgi:acyl-CoA synthetase (AMP-forming)/AMP-acid ligase II
MYLTQSLHRAVQQRPNHLAVRFGKRTRTFEQLGDRVARLAGALQSLGLGAGDRVAMLSLNSDRYLEYLMAVPWAGGVLNPCNVRWSAQEILYSLADSGSAMLLVDDTFVPLAKQIRAAGCAVRTWIYCGDDSAPADMHSYEDLMAAASAVADAGRRDSDLAGIFYTGGTTGSPKGVMLSHANLGWSAMAMMAEGLGPAGATYLHAAPMFHLADIGLAAPHWMQGNTHSIVPAFSADAVLDTIERDGVTHVLLVPTMVQLLVDRLAAAPRQRDLSSLQTIVYGAAPMAEALLDRATAALPQVEFVQAYGMTELAPLATINPALRRGPGGRPDKRLATGRASPCVELRVVDANGREVPRGVVGEIAVRGPNVMLGYWNKPIHSVEVLRDGWLHTGDGAFMDNEGYITIVDRMKDMIISGGENVYSAEVENAVLKHPAVAQCAVIGIPSEHWGEAVHAVLVLRPGMTATQEEIIAHAKSLIAGYKCPRSMQVVDSLPLSGPGKVLKTKLREPFWADHDRQVA